jgi:hypothetical protein
VLGDIRPVVTEPERAVFVEGPYEIGTVYVHTSNPSAADTMVAALRHAGSAVIRVYAGDALVSAGWRRP